MPINDRNDPALAIAGENIIKRVLPFEGGIKQVKGESWVTYYGQTPQWLKTWGFEPPTCKEEAIDNYVEWLHKTKLIGVCDPPDHLALAVVDWAINHGHLGAIKLLQTLMKDVDIDGKIGPQTYRALRRRGAEERNGLALLYNSARVRAYADMVARNPKKYQLYLRGWMNRVTHHLDQIALDNMRWLDGTILD